LATDAISVLDPSGATSRQNITRDGFIFADGTDLLTCCLAAEKLLAGEVERSPGKRNF